MINLGDGFTIECDGSLVHRHKGNEGHFCGSYDAYGERIDQYWCWDFDCKKLPSEEIFKKYLFIAKSANKL